MEGAIIASSDTCLRLCCDEDVSRRRRGGAWTPARGDGSADGDGIGWHSQGLHSQLSLQEKLKKVRSQFADIRKQVGFD